MFRHVIDRAESNRDATICGDKRDHLVGRLRVHGGVRNVVGLAPAAGDEEAVAGARLRVNGQSALHVG